MSYNFEEELFMKSKAGKKCINYLESIKGSTISQKESDRIRNKYTMDFFEETKYNGAFGHIDNMFIPYILFKKYNIIVDKNKLSFDEQTYAVSSYDISKPESKKTAPTLSDGWYIYILVMLVLSIFHERILGWIVATIIFLLWKSNEINKYN
jgi:hypothetical protein